MAADLNTTTLAGPITASQTVIRLTSASLVTAAICSTSARKR